MCHGLFAFLFNTQMFFFLFCKYCDCMPSISKCVNCMGWCTYAYMSGGQWFTSRVFLYRFSPYSWDKLSHWTWNFLFWLDGLGCESSGSPTSTLFLVTGGIRVVSHYSWIFMSVVGIRTRISGLHSKNYPLTHLPGLHLFFRLLLCVTKSDEEDLGQKWCFYI